MKKSFTTILIAAGLAASAVGQAVVLNNKLNTGSFISQTNGRVFMPPLLASDWMLFDGLANNIGVTVLVGPSPNDLQPLGLGTYRAATDPKGYTGWDFGQFALGDDSPVNVPGVPAGATAYIRLQMWFDGPYQNGLFPSFAAAVAATD